MSQLAQEQQQEDSTHNQRYHALAQEANARTANMVEGSAIEDMPKAHAAEAETSKVTYTHHIAELNEQLGDTQAENTTLRDDFTL